MLMVPVGKTTPPARTASIKCTGVPTVTEFPIGETNPFGKALRTSTPTPVEIDGPKLLSPSYWTLNRCEPGTKPVGAMLSTSTHPLPPWFNGNVPTLTSSSAMIVALPVADPSPDLPPTLN